MTFSTPRDNNFYQQGTKTKVEHQIVQAAKYNSETNFSLDRRFSSCKTVVKDTKVVKVSLKLVIKKAPFSVEELFENNFIKKTVSFHTTKQSSAPSQRKKTCLLVLPGQNKSKLCQKNQFDFFFQISSIDDQTELNTNLSPEF